MRFYLKTLIDVTQTNARRGEDPFEIRQQQNFMTLTQTLGLRVNPYFDEKPTISEMSIDNLGFGNKYKGKHKVWEFFFDIEYEEGLTVEALQEDFDIVPVISNLHETIKLDISAFRSQDKAFRNIIFSSDDK